MIEPYKISVIVPIFKTEAYLRRCLDSIVNNTYGCIHENVCSVTKYTF